MGALAATTPTLAGVAASPAAVAASDTIAQALLGARGAHLKVINGNASGDDVTISDHGSTRAGNELPSNAYSATVAAGASTWFLIRPEQVDPSTGLVTITHSVTTTVTYELLPLG